mmetsp:Transcript_2403/g.3853  ORF Transcript_2403/g.3853 Transcript_2403/m.3853 type:complete len:528 (-) Transcript_2403:405-1988(-)
MLTASMSATTTTTTATTTENIFGYLSSQDKRRSRWLYPQEPKKKLNNCGEDPVWSYRNDPPDGETAEATITCIDFDHSGERLAIGDRCGRVALFRQCATEKSNLYTYEAQFKSHDPEFDYLKSLEIEEKINKLRFLKHRAGQPTLLTTNDKTIKLWKVNPESKICAIERYGGLRLPRVSTTGIQATASQRKIYAGAHAYHINTISPCADGETFLSADDLRINIWHFDVTDQTFNIIDLKPINMEDLTEVITTATFHPTCSHLFMYASSKGSIKMYDLRDSARCHLPVTTLTCSGTTRNLIKKNHQQVRTTDSSSSSDEDDDLIETTGSDASYGQRSFFSEIVTSISDARFLDYQDTHQYIVARDYLSVKLWDTRKPNIPVTISSVHEQLEHRLSELYDSDRIFDKFEVAPLNKNLLSSNPLLISGSYSNSISLFNLDATTQQRHELILPGSGGNGISSSLFDKNKPNLDQRCLHTASHPTRPLIAAASQDALHIFDLALLPQYSSSRSSTTTKPQSYLSNNGDISYF